MPKKYPYLCTNSEIKDKNDLWIAVIASLLNLELTSTEDGFDHLLGVFLNLRRIDIYVILNMLR